MKDPRMLKLAKSIIHYSVELKPGEKILIEAFGAPYDLVNAMIAETYAVGGVPLVQLQMPSVQRALMLGCTKEQLSLMAKYDAARMSDCQAYVGLRAGDNSTELADVPPEKSRLFATEYSRKVHSEIRIPQTRWVVLRYPTPGMAQQARMSLEGFEDFYFNVCTLDYARMSRAMDALVRRMEATDKVRIVGPGTDLSFSIKGLPAIKCDGKVNIPDGEVFTAPVRDSVEGTISYNTQSVYQGTTFSDIRLGFEKGRVIFADGSDSVRINQILDTDPGARYVGEFAIGVNPYITNAMGDTLFDEKIAGSFHFTPGNSYDECPNGNKSAVHWDIVNIQTAELGGGEIYFDGELIRKDGFFVTRDLMPLNPDALK